MKIFRQRMKEEGVIQAFSELGLDFDHLFPGDDEKLYSRYEWIVRTKVPRFGTIINAIPPDEWLGEKAWEEWYILDGVLHHHVLCLTEPANYNEIFMAPELDDVHPPRSFGKKWYVTDDPDMRPVLRRK